MLRKIADHKKISAALFIIAAALTAAYFVLCSIASGKANEIFRREMARQQVLAGRITAADISADIWGNVYFRRLVWLDDKGEPILDVPSGRLKISMLDVITGKITGSSLREIELNEAALTLGFSKDMKLEMLTKKPPAKKAAQAGAAAGKNRPARRNRNLQLPEELPRLELLLHDCTLTVLNRKRLFRLNDVDARIAIANKQELRISLKTGPFGGTIAGDSLNLSGKAALGTEGQPVSFNLSMYNVIPASLGLGKVENPANIGGEVKGSVQDPKIDGVIRFEELDIPALHFTNVSGNFHYEDGSVNFTDVTGSVFGGTVEAFGSYDIDSRSYSIDAQGKDLMAAAAAKSTKINCSVDLDLKMRSEGKPDSVKTYGSFKSGPGSYMLIPFKSISGKFDDQHKVLKFADVVIETELGTVSTDAFSIEKGRVKLNDIYFDAGDGNRLKIR